MNKQFIYLISLLGILTAVSITITVAQEDDTAILNNVSQKNATLNHTSVNLSVFRISDNVTAKSMNGFRLDASAENSEIQYPKRATFVINGYVRPTIDAIYEDGSLLNAAYLSRGVEGTPHGYVTYFN